MEAHIFQLKDDVPASAGGGTMWLSMGSPRNAPYLPYYGNILNTYQAYQELGIITMIALGIGPFKNQ